VLVPRWKQYPGDWWCTASCSSWELLSGDLLRLAPSPRPNQKVVGLPLPRLPSVRADFSRFLAPSGSSPVVRWWPELGDLIGVHGEELEDRIAFLCQIWGLLCTFAGLVCNFLLF
jgi:hypothetical protein